MKSPRKTMSGAHLGARVLALEAFVMVALEAIIDQPSIKQKDAQALLVKMATSAKDLAKETNHPEVITEAEMYIDDVTDRLRDALPKMRDGKAG